MNTEFDAEAGMSPTRRAAVASAALVYSSFSWIVTVVLVCAVFNPTVLRAQNEADEAAIRKLVEQLFASHQKRDLDGAMACWSAKSPLFAGYKQYLQNDFVTSEETQFLNVALTRWKIGTNQATARLRYERRWRDAKTKQSGRQTLVFDVMFVKEADGWKFWQQSNVINDLAARLTAAKTKDEREGLLKNEREAVTLELVRALGNAGVAQANQGKLGEALRLSDISLEVAEQVGEVIGKAHGYLARATILDNQSKHEEALESYRIALRFFQEAKDRGWEAWTLVNLGQALEPLGRYEEALEQFAALLKIRRETGDRAGEAIALGNIGDVYQLTGMYAEALEEYEADLSIKRALGDLLGEAAVLNNIGLVYESTSRYAEALARYELSLKIKRELGDKAGEAATLNNLGIVYYSTGRFAEALAQYDAGLKIKHELGDKAGEAETLGNIGNVYLDMGRYAEASSRYEDNLRVMVEIGDRPGQAKALNNIGLIYETTGRYAEALAQYEASLKISRDIGDRAEEAATLGNVGIVYDLMGKYAEALTQFEASLKMMRAICDRVGEANALHNIGLNYRLRGSDEEALAQYEAGLKISREIGNRLGEAQSLKNMGEVYRSRKQWRQAADVYRKAIELIEQTRLQSREPSLQTSFFARHTSAYYGLVESLLELGSSRDEVLAVSERARARTLVDLMAGGKVSVLKSMTDAERRREQELNSNIIAATAQLDNALAGPAADDQRVDSLKKQLEQARAEYDEFRRQLFITHPELQTQRALFDPLTLAQLGEVLFAGRPGLCLLSYLVGQDKSLLLVIKAGKGAHAHAALNVYPLKVENDKELTADELKRRLDEFRLRYTNESGVYKPLARELYELLLAPAEKDLRGKSHIVIIPDGVLHALPFHALLDRQGRHLIENHTVSYAPSVTALVEMMKLADRKKNTNAGSRPLFAMGRRAFPDQARYRNSELPWAEEEVKSIARLFDVSPLTGVEATEAKAKSDMPWARYVHFATHGELNEVAPMYSAIVLGKDAGDDGMLYARELVDMNLQAELVVLSACDTGLGQTVSGEGIIGLTWALFVAGTPSSIVTQWKVRNDSMEKLMTEFYRQLRPANALRRQPVSKAEALRRAQLTLLKSHAYAHPYHWAPVALVGDWR
jgi:CHAT domain-containing protein/Tfp pilus assembly protein PilF